MLDDVGIRGIRPIDDHASRRENRRPQKPGESRKKEPKKKEKRKKEPPAREGGIDIVI